MMQQKSGYECSENPEEGVVISKRVKLVVRRLRAFLVEMIGNLNVRHNVRLPTAAGSTQSATNLQNLQVAQGALSLQGFIDSVVAAGLVDAHRMAESDADMSSIWFLREHISVALSKRGEPLDVSSPPMPAKCFHPSRLNLLLQASAHILQPCGTFSLVTQRSSV